MPGLQPLLCAVTLELLFFFFLEKFDSKLFRSYLTPTQDVAIEETIYL